MLAAHDDEPAAPTLNKLGHYLLAGAGVAGQPHHRRRRQRRDYEDRARHA
jgi:hypothetical protein